MVERVGGRLEPLLSLRVIDMAEVTPCVKTPALNTSHARL